MCLETKMTICIDKYRKVETYLEDKKIQIIKRICQIYMAGEGEEVPSGESGVVDYTVSQRKGKTLKTAYVKLGNVQLGWFHSTPTQGIYIEEIPLPRPFSWKKNHPTLEKLVDCNIPEKIEDEFGINITKYLY